VRIRPLAKELEHILCFHVHLLVTLTLTLRRPKTIGFFHTLWQIYLQSFKKFHQAELNLSSGNTDAKLWKDRRTDWCLDRWTDRQSDYYRAPTPSDAGALTNPQQECALTYAHNLDTNICHISLTVMHTLSRPTCFTLSNVNIDWGKYNDTSWSVNLILVTGHCYLLPIKIYKWRPFSLDHKFKTFPGLET
jgi:hypothetical protein